MLTFFIIWIIFSILCGVYANSKGRSSILFFFLSLIISPLIGFIAILILGENKEITQQTQISSGENKKCPFCAELIKMEAIVCRYCGKDLPKDAMVVDIIIHQLPDEVLMSKYGIKFESDKYWFGNYSYDELKDAISYAKLEIKRNGS